MLEIMRDKYTTDGRTNIIPEMRVPRGLKRVEA